MPTTEGFPTSEELLDHSLSTVGSDSLINKSMEHVGLGVTRPVLPKPEQRIDPLSGFPIIPEADDRLATGQIPGIPETSGPTSEGKNFFQKVEANMVGLAASMEEKGFIRQGIDLMKSMHFIHFPKMREDAILAKWDHLLQGLSDYALFPWSPEGEMVSRTWPSARRFRLRQAAVRQVYDEWAVQQGFPEGQLAAMQVDLGQKQIMQEIDSFLERNNLPEVPEERIQQVETDINRREMEPWLRLNLWGMETHPERKWAEVQTLFLQEVAGKAEGGMESEQYARAQEMIAQVNRLNEDLGVDPELETAHDLVIKHGMLTGRPLADAWHEVVQDPMFILGFFTPPLKAEKAAMSVVDIAVAEGEKVGMLPKLAQKMRQAGSQLEEIEKLNVRPPRNARQVAQEITRPAPIEAGEIRGLRRSTTRLDLAAEAESRPHGLFVSTGEAAIAEDLAEEFGHVRQHLAIRSEDVLTLSEDVAVPGSLRPSARMETIPATDANVAALRELEPETFDRLIQEGVRGGKQAIEEALQARFPGAMQPHTDALEALSTFGAQVARERGFAGIRLLDPGAPALEELVILRGSAVRELPEFVRETIITGRQPSPTRQAAEKAAKAFVKAEGKGERPLRFLADVESDLARNVEQRTRIQAKVTQSTRDQLLESGLAVDEEMADEMVALTTRRTKTPVGDLAELITRRVEDVTPEQARGMARLARREMAPIRAWQSYLRAQEKYRATETGLVTRSRALGQAYQETLQQVDALRMRVHDDLIQLGADEKYAEKMLAEFNPRRIEATIEDIMRVEKFEESGGIFKTLTGMSPMNRSRTAFTDTFLFEPRIVLGGTEAWQALTRGDRSYTMFMKNARDMVGGRFGWLATRGTPFQRVPTPEAFQGLSRAARKELDERLGMALDGQVVGETAEGGLRFRWRAANVDGEIVKTEQVTLSAAEAAVYQDARAFFDDMADQMTAAGVKGFNRGTPILDYFPRVYDETVLPLRAGGGREIPPELLDAVSSNIYFKHAQPRLMADRLVAESLPTLTGALKSYVPGVARKLTLEPALKQALGVGKALRPAQQDYLKGLVNIMKGKPNSFDRGVDSVFRWGIEQFAKVPGAPRKKLLEVAARRPGYRLALAVHNAYYRSLLGGSLASGLTNLAQSINTAASEGTFNMMRGVSLFADRRMRKIYQEEGLLEDFTNLFEQTLPVLENGGFATLRTLEDIVMSPMTVAEYTNRGIAFWSGISKAAKGKVRSFEDWIALSPKEQQALIAQGIDTVESTQFIYGRLGQAPFFQHAGSKNLTTLVSFPVKQSVFLMEQMKNDPTGLARFFALSGWMTRLNRDMLGLSSEHAVGFGFIPEDMGPFPMASPEVSWMVDLVSYAKAESPSDKKRAFNSFANRTSQFLAGAIAGKFPPAVLFAGVPRQDTGLKLPGLPEIETDLGARQAQTIFRGLRQLDSVHLRALEEALPGETGFGEGVVRGPNRRLIREDITEQEQVAGLLGLRPEANRASYSMFNAQRGLETKIRDMRRELDQNLDAALNLGNMELYQKLYQEGLDSGLIELSELLDAGGVQLPSVAGTFIPQGLRSIMRSPGLLTQPEGQGLMLPPEGSAVPPLE